MCTSRRAFGVQGSARASRREFALCRLTFELSGRRRQDARPGLAKMYCVPPDRAWWRAVGAPLERGVRHRWIDCSGNSAFYVEESDIDEDRWVIESINDTVTDLSSRLFASEDFRRERQRAMPLCLPVPAALGVTTKPAKCFVWDDMEANIFEACLLKKNG